jgi:VCBS repeat-containing protein
MPFVGVIAMPDTVGNNLANAKPVYLIASSKTFNESIGVENGVLDSDDYYSFTLNRSSSFTLSLTGLTADANVEVLDKTTGAVVTDVDGIVLRSTNTGTLTESINTILGAGTYYIHVFPGPAANSLDPLNTTPSTTYSLNVAANNSAKTDIIWRNYRSGQNAIWRMNGTSFESASFPTLVSDTNWKIQGSGDFNNDGQADILWRNSASGQNLVWIMNGSASLSNIALPTVKDSSWQIGGVGDFNQDNKPDIVWRNYSSAQNVIWFMNGSTLATTTFIDTQPRTDHKIQAVGDFDGDGQADIVFRDYSVGTNTTGVNTVWIMNGSTRASILNFDRLTDLNWQIYGAGDFNGDGKSDLLWHNTASNANVIWLLNGTTLKSTVSLPTLPDPNWLPLAPFTRYSTLVKEDIAGNTRASAFSIGPLNGNGAYYDSASDGDSNDYYQFSLGGLTSLSLALNGINGGNLSGNLDIQILDNSGALILASAQPGNAVETITTPPTANLASGNYYIRVFSQPGESSSYKLSLSSNNLPVLVTKNNLSVNEGLEGRISSSLLRATDENNSPSQLTYTVVASPGTLTNGNLKLNGAAITIGSTFTQADINANKLSYAQNGSETLTDSFVFNVSDGVGGTIDNTTYTINVVPVNDNPILVSNTGLTLSEGSATTLTTLNLLATDIEQPASQLVYSLSNLPASGSLVLNGTTLTAGSTFTQADIASGTQLKYRHNGSETLSDSFVFTLGDGAGGTLTPAATTFSIAVSPINDPPVLTTNLGLSVSQDESKAITSAVLTATDVEFLTLPDAIVYTVTTSPTRGTLYRDSTATTSFTQADLNAGRIFYDHDGSNTNSDTFTFTVSDGVNTLSPANFNITVNRTNFAPVLATNAGLTVSEGTTAAITNTLLQITDLDNAPPQLVYTLQSIPTHGTLNRFGTPLTVGQTFSQADINSLPNSRITYVHDGSETLNDTFSFRASDGSSSVIPTTTFSINITPVNDAPVLVSKGSLSLAEGSSVTIDNTILKITDNDTPTPSSLVYSISNAPTNGTLFLGTTAVTSFTQADVESGQLKYLHNGSESNSDSFTFTISDGVVSTPLGPNTVNVAITPVNDAPGISLNAGLTVSEGLTAAITNTALLVTDADGPNPVTYTLNNGPAKGTLKLGSVVLSANQTFTQADIANGRLSYTHDGSETLSDNFSFAASDGITGTIPATTTFTISVTPVNDLPVLVSNSGLSLSEAGSVTINNSVLQITDGDSPPPSSLIYSVSNLPTNGTLFLGTTAVTSFTQADVTSGQLKYSHNGSESVSDNFTFTITDGVISTPLGPNTVNIAITPVNDSPSISLNTGLTVSEGLVGTISNTALLVTDPDGPGPITYTLGSTPTRGSLILGGLTLSSGQTFTQADINNSQLSYVHNGSETTSDSFIFTASDGSTGTVSPKTFGITVTPVNDPPTLTLPSSQSVNEDNQLTFSGATRISLSDAENNNPITVALSVANGTITLSSTAGVTGNGTNSVTVVGTVTAVNTALNNLIYRPTANFSGPDAIAFTANDGFDTSKGTIDITVAAVNDAPTLTIPTGTQTATEDAPLALTISTTDIDSNASPVRASVAATNGVLNLATTNGVSFLDGANGTSTLSLEGTIADIQAALSTLTYQGNPDYNGTDSIILTINDQGGTGSPGPLSVTRTIPINVRPVNDAPSFIGGANQTVNEDAGTQTVTGWATSILQGPANESGQTLNFNIVSNSNPTLFTAGGQPVISPNGTLTYTPTANAFGSSVITVRLQDSGGTSLGGVDTSSNYTFTLNVNPVNDAPTFTKGGNVTVTEDTPAQSVLWATNISSGPANEAGQTTGFLISNDNPSLFAVAPTIAPNGTLSYTLAQDANGIANITVQLQDNGGTDNGGIDTSTLQSFVINVTPVNDAPTLTLPGTQTVDEDTNLNITGISINDIDAGSGNVRVTLNALGTGTPSTGGNINFGSTAGLTVVGNNSNSVTLTGKLTDLNNALNSFNYQGQTNVNGTDQIVVTVNDQGLIGAGGAKSATQTLNVNINPVNDAPVLSVAGGTTRTVAEDTLLTLSGITVTDVDAGTSNMQVTVSVLQGLLNATAAGSPATTISGTGTNALTITGSQAAINSTLSNLRYQGNLNYNGPDVVTIAVNDQGNTGNVGGSLTDTRSLSINVTPVNDLPTLTLPTTPLNINEDADLIFTGPTAIALTDVDSGTNPIRVTLGVTNGTLNLATDGLTTISGSNGTKAAVYEGTIDAIVAAINTLIYRGNLNYSGPDRLTITVNDKGFTGATSGIDVTRTVDIGVTPVNDPPVLVTNNALTLNEGASQVITNGLLRTTDVDNSATSLVYTIQAGSIPLNGNLLRGSTILGVSSTFTQDDVDQGLIRYVHNGGETTSDSFTFQVSDGGSAPITANFNINVNPINDVPTLVVNQTLPVTEGQSGIINNTLLLSSDPDNTASQLAYTVTNLPSSGSVRLNGSNLTIGQSFTQQDVNLNRVTYRHDGSETTTDSFTFTVSDGAGGNIGSTSFRIGVTPVDDPPLVVSNGPLTISEGAITTITKTVLQTTDPESQPLTYKLVAQPLHGTLSLNGATLTTNSTFTQADIDSGRLSYQHDGSETSNDAFFYNVTDGTTGSNQIFNINVTPVNDPPQFLTPNPTITVPGDVSSVTEISAGVLQVTDVDNKAGQLVYRLVSAPNSTYGQLKLNGSSLLTGQTFTQADIDAGKVTYQSVGGGSTDTFQFSVSDGGSGGTLPTQYFTINFSYPGS